MNSALKKELPLSLWAFCSAWHQNIGFSQWTFELLHEVNIWQLLDGRISLDLCCTAGDELVLDLYSALTAQTVGLWLGPQDSVSLEASVFSGQVQHWVQVYLRKCPNLCSHCSGPFCLPAQCHWLSYWQKASLVLCSCGKSWSQDRLLTQAPAAPGTADFYRAFLRAELLVPTLSYSCLSSCWVGSWKSSAKLCLQLYFFVGFVNLHFRLHNKMRESQVFSRPILQLITNQIFGSWVILPSSWNRLRLILVICRWCYTTSGGVLAPEILVNSYTVPASTYLTPLRFLFFLGILGGMGFITAVWWKMSKLLSEERCSSSTQQSSGWCFQLESERDEPPLPFLNPSLLLRVRTCSQSFGIPA